MKLQSILNDKYIRQTDQKRIGIDMADIGISKEGRRDYRRTFWRGARKEFELPTHLPAVRQMVASIGRERSAALLPYFHQTKNGISCTPYDRLPPGVAPDFELNGQRVSPLVLGTPPDLSFYSVKDVCGDSLPYLCKYLLMPTRSGKFIFVSDDHNHAFFAISLAEAAGIITKGAALIHVDTHRDNCIEVISPAALSSLRQRAIFGRNLHYGSWFSPLISLEIIDLESVVYVLPGKQDPGTREKLTEKKPDLHLSGGWDLSLDLLIEEVRLRKAKGQSVVLDIDLDYFAGYLVGKFIFQNDVVRRKEEIIDKTLRILLLVAEQADFITIATSPNFFFAQTIPLNVREIFYKEVIDKFFRHLNQ